MEDKLCCASIQLGAFTLQVPPATIVSIDDVFQALRSIEARVDDMDRMAPTGKTAADVDGG